MDVQVQDNDVQAKDGLDEQADEAQRVANIASICGTKHPDIQAQAIEDGWDENRTELEVLRASRPKVPSVLGSTPMVASGSVLEAALLTHMGHIGLGEKALGPVAMEQADRLGATSMIDLCRAALRVDGREVPSSRMELVKAALSTMSLPTALGNVANKVLLDNYNETPASWRSFCAIRSTSDFKANTAIRPTFTGQLEQVPAGGELKHGGVSEALTTFAVDTFGKMLSIDRRDIINDDLNRFYVGDIVWRGEVYPGKHRPLVDRQTFQLCRNILKGKNRRTFRLAHTFANGTLLCQYCGSMMTGERIRRKLKGGGVRVHTYYRCANNKPGDDHPKVRWKEEDVEQQVLNELDAMKMPTGETEAMELCERGPANCAAHSSNDSTPPTSRQTCQE